MRKLLLAMLMGVLGSPGSFAQLNEGFEGTLPIEGWEITPLNVSPGWSQAEYQSNATLKNIIKGYAGGGEKALMSVSGGFGFALTPTDNWMITSPVTIGDHPYLQFMLGANGSHNGLTNGTAGEFSFEVLISETTNQRDQFDELLFQFTPVNIVPWGAYCINLERYKGKTVYIAFRDHGTYTQTSFINNFTYLDDISMISGGSSDLALLKAASPVKGCETEQPVTVTVRNTGIAVNSFDICYQNESGEIERETFTQPIGMGESKTVTFTKPATLTAGRKNKLTVWSELEADPNAGNDTLIFETEIIAELPFPYSDTSSNLKNDFINYSSNIRYGWQWYNDQYCWKYTKYSNVNSLLESNCIFLNAGKVRVNFDYKGTVDFSMVAKLGKFIVNEYVEAGKSGLYNMSLEEWKKGSMILSVPEDGLHSIGLVPVMSAAVGELLINNIEIMEVFDDISIKKILSPSTSAKALNSEITVRAVFRNECSEPLQKIPVYYQLNNLPVQSEVIETLIEGEEIEVVFPVTASLTETGSSVLKIWSALSSDQNNANDTLIHQINVYEPRNFPYQTGFEEEEDYYMWSSVNPDADKVFWGSSGQVAIKGTHCAYMNSFSGVEHNDWFVSPAIRLPKGKARISFYYATTYTTGESSLKLFMGQGDQPENLTTKLVDVKLEDRLKPKIGYALLDIEEEGLYHFGFYNDGFGRDVVLDDVRIDATEDLAALEISVNAKTGFNLNSGEVTFTFTNLGMTTRQNIQVSYTVNGKDIVNEIVSDTLAPGEKYVYTFNRKVDLSVPGSYIIKASVTDPDDSDSFNNGYTADLINHYENKKIPCVLNFPDEKEISYWTLNGTWASGMNFTSANAAYDGTAAIRHTGKASDEGDWAYSPAITIPAGTYEFSYFFRTFLGMSTDEYLQSYEVYLGLEPSSEAMKMLIHKDEAVAVSGKEYRKVRETITIESEGNYYIGVKCTSSNTYGSLFMDNFQIKYPVTEGAKLPYEADFANREEEWYHYNPSVSHFEQWVKQGEETDAYMKTQVFVTDFATKSVPGIYRTPAFWFSKDDVVTVNYDYSIHVNPDAQPSDEQFIALFLADTDMPDAFTTLVAKGCDNTGGQATASGEIVIPEDGFYYFGYKIGSPVTTDAFYLFTTTVTKTNPTHLCLAENENASFRIKDKTIFVTGDYLLLDIYNANGIMTGRYQGNKKIDLSGLQSGVYLVVFQTEKGRTTTKVVLP